MITEADHKEYIKLNYYTILVRLLEAEADDDDDEADEGDESSARPQIEDDSCLVSHANMNKLFGV